jgi:hypothetical protein
MKTALRGRLFSFDDNALHPIEITALIVSARRLDREMPDNANKGRFHHLFILISNDATMSYHKAPYYLVSDIDKQNLGI